MSKIRIKEENVERDANGNYVGKIYMLTNLLPGPEYGWIYIGSTTNDDRRKQDFYGGKNEYAGDKINEARRTIGSQNFKREILEIIVEKDFNVLIEQLNERETEYIIAFNSIERGYNMTTGVGRKKVPVLVVDGKGIVVKFNSITEAGDAYGMKEGSVRYWLSSGKATGTGIQFKIAS